MNIGTCWEAKWRQSDPQSPKTTPVLLSLLLLEQVSVLWTCHSKTDGTSGVKERDGSISTPQCTPSHFSAPRVCTFQGEYIRVINIIVKHVPTQVTWSNISHITILHDSVILFQSLGYCLFCGLQEVNYYLSAFSVKRIKTKEFAVTISNVVNSTCG
jgi:hypothetical protein